MCHRCVVNGVEQAERYEAVPRRRLTPGSLLSFSQGLEQRRVA